MVGRWWIDGGYQPQWPTFLLTDLYLFIILVAIQQNQQKLTDTVPEQIVEYIPTSKYLITTDAVWPTNTHGEFTWLYNIGLQTYVILSYNCSDFHYHYNAITYYIFLSLHVAFQSMYHFIPDHLNLWQRQRAPFWWRPSARSVQRSWPVHWHTGNSDLFSNVRNKGSWKKAVEKSPKWWPLAK